MRPGHIPMIGWRTWVAAALFGALLGSPSSVPAQERSTPTASTAPFMSQTREEVQAELNEELGYTEATTPGGTFIDANTGDIRTIHPLLAEDEDSLAVVGLL